MGASNRKSIFSSRINNKGALATLFSGLFIAIFKIAMEVLKDGLDANGVFYAIADMNFLKFSSFFFLYCVAVAVLVSLFTKRVPKEDLEDLTFGTISERQKQINKESYNWIDITASIFVILIVVYVMMYFS